MNDAECLRRRAVLLEFLKFRVLAAGQDFFDSEASHDRRAWLSLMHPQALALSDVDLDLVWNQARILYTEA